MKRDKQLSKNFNLREFIEAKAIDKAYYPGFWVALEKNKEHQKNLADLAKRLQKLRDKINKIFQTPDGVKFIITSSYRPLDYELKKGRSGRSQHVLGKAADIVPVNIPIPLLYQKIEKELED